MLVVEDSRQLALKLKNPERVLQVIPQSRVVDEGGEQSVVFLPHGMEEVRVLRNIGISAPSPILHYYDWPGRFKPFAAQIDTAQFLTVYPRAFVLNDMGCVDSETEYLSPTGWVKISEYKGGEVGQYWPDRRAVEFVQPKGYIKKPCPQMVRIKTKYGLDQLLSPEHRVLVHSVRNPGKRQVLSASDLLLQHNAYKNGKRRVGKSKETVAFSNMGVPVVFTAPEESGLSLTLDELRVQVAVIADGHFGSKTTSCVVRLKKDRKKKRLRFLLSSARIGWKEREQNTATAQGFTVFTFRAPLRDKEFDEKYWRCTSQQRKVVADEVLYWDSNVPDNPARGWRFSTSKKMSADFVQYCGVDSGLITRVNEFRRTRRGREEVEYTVQFRQGKKNSTDLQILSSTTKTMWAESSTDGFKYCFSVPSTFLIFRRNGCVFASGNTGKTISALWAYDFLRGVGLAKKLLVVSPLSSLDPTWANTIFNNFMHLTCIVLHGTRVQRLKMLEEDVDVYIINHDGIKTGGLEEALKVRADITHIIVDEIASFSNARTDRWDVLNRICNKQAPRAVWGLTGSPTPNEPTDAWGQCRLLNPDSVSPYYGRFRDQVMRQVNQYRWVPRPDSAETVSKFMRPAIRYKRDECVDLPPVVFQTRHIELLPAQAKAYKQMLATLSMESAQGKILAVNEGVKAGKLLQIACGVVYGDNDKEVVLEATNRLNEVMQVIEEAAAKVIVFVPFVGAVEYVHKFIQDKLDAQGAGHEVALVHGEVTKNQRDTIFRRFQDPQDPLRVIAAQPGTMSHSLTLTEADTILWFAPVHSNGTFQQAIARISRPGQRRTQLIIMIEGTEIERRIYHRLQHRERLQGALLKMIKGEAE